MATNPAAEDSKALIKEVESALDRSLRGLASARCSSKSVLSMAICVAEAVALENPGAHAALYRGINVLAPIWLHNQSTQGDDGEIVDYATLTSDLLFGSHYFIIRDLLYYGYNAPSSVLFSRDNNTISIKFAQDSIPRQFFTSINGTIIDSIEAFAGIHEERDTVLSLLRGTPEFNCGESIQPALDLIELEVKLKFERYFPFANSSTELGRYTFGTFSRVYSIFMQKALYHRYWAAANESSCLHVEMGVDEMVHAISNNEGIGASEVRHVIEDLTYGLGLSRIPPMHYSLFYCPQDDKIVLGPNYFATRDGHVDALRVSAARFPDRYVNVIAPTVAAGLVAHVAESFCIHGFSCITNLLLRDFDPSLPDIDVLAIRQEPTFGFILYACEVKAPIPPSWSKDHLRALDGDSVKKSFGQLGRIRAFLATERGIALIRSKLPTGGLPNFGEEFIVAVRFIVVTSWNSGMFFDDAECPVVDYRTLRRSLVRSDGDVVAFQAFLHAFRTNSEQFYELVEQECEMDGLRVTYEGVTERAIVDFPLVSYRSAGLEESIALEFISAGGRPLDTLALLASPHQPETQIQEPQSTTSPAKDKDV